MADTWAVKPKVKKPEDEELSLEELTGGSPDGELSLEELTGAAPAKPTGKMDPLKKATAQLTTGFDLGGFNAGSEAAAGVATAIDNASHFLGFTKEKPKTYREYLDLADAGADEYNARRQLPSDDEASIAWDEWGNLGSNAAGAVIGAAPYGLLFKGGNLAAQGLNRLAGWAFPKATIPLMEQGRNAAVRVAPKWFETGLGWILGGAAANKLNEFGAVRLSPEEREFADAEDARGSPIPGSQLASSIPGVPSAFGLGKAATPLLETIVVGGAEGLGGGAFGHSLGLLGRAAGEHFVNPVKSAGRTLARQIYEAGQTIDDIVKSHADNLKLDPRATLDTAGPQGSELLQRAAATAARGGGGPLEEFNALVKPRQAHQSRDVAAATENALGSKGGSFKVTLDELSNKQATEAKAAYDAANAAPKLSSPIITEILHRPTIKPVFEQALQRAMDSGKPESAFITRDANGTITEISTELVNIVKKRLDANAGIAYKAGDVDTGGYFKQMKRQLVAIADELNPLYAKARKLWAGEEEMQEALEAGFKAFGQGRDEVAYAMKKYADNPSLMETFVTGFSQKASKSALDTSEEGNAVIKMLGNANKQDSFRQILGDEAYDLYVKTMDLKSKQYRTFFEGKKQSATDLRQNESAALKAESTADLLEARAFDAAQISADPIGFVRDKGMARFLNVFRGFDAAKRGYIIRWLLSPDPKIQQQGIDAMRKEFEWARASAQAAQRGEGLGGSLVNAAGRPIAAQAISEGQ